MLIIILIFKQRIYTFMIIKNVYSNKSQSIHEYI
jgi:hypothetical protein